MPTPPDSSQVHPGGPETATVALRATEVTQVTPDVVPLADRFAGPDGGATWAALTVRVAWTLLAEGVRVKPGVLRDARDHVLFLLPPELPAALAEDRASVETARFVARARRKAWDDPWPQDWEMPLSPRWKRQLDRGAAPLHAAVAKLHYGDGRPLESLERVLNVDRTALDAARGGLRELARQIVAADGLPVETWPNPRLDRLLRRLAAWSPGPCPPVLEVAEGRHRDHVAACPRCDRTARLVRSQVLRPADLLLPSTAALPSGDVTLLAVHFHADARRHRDRWLAEAESPPASARHLLPLGAAPIADDLLLVDATDPERAYALVRLACEVGAPAREGVRAAIVRAPGRWSLHGVLGEAGDRAEAQVRSRAWGDVEGMETLPIALPEPPSTRRAWTLVAGLAVAAAVAWAVALAPQRDAPAFALDVDFAPGRGGVWATFDVDDDANLALVRDLGGKLDVVMSSATPADKSKFALGDGAFRVHTQATGLLVAASPAPLSELTAWASAAPNLDALAKRIHDAQPRADVAVGWADR